MIYACRRPQHPEELEACEIGQLFFVFLILGLERSFRTLEIHWPRLVRRLPGYAVGSLGAFWTLQRTFALFGSGG